MADSVRKTSRVEASFINIYNAMLERSELFCKAMEGVAAASWVSHKNNGRRGKLGQDRL